VSSLPQRMSSQGKRSREQMFRLLLLIRKNIQGKFLQEISQELQQSLAQPYVRSVNALEFCLA
jgi:hypothetical protein